MAKQIKKPKESHMRKSLRVKGYVLCRRNADGQIECMTEHSFWMDWSTSMCNVWVDPPLHCFKPNEGHFIVRVHSKKCPFELDYRFKGSKYNHYFWPKGTPKEQRIGHCRDCGAAITAEELIWIPKWGYVCKHCPDEVLNKHNIPLKMVRNRH